MKLLVSLLVFAITLALSYQTLASEPSPADSHAATTENHSGGHGDLSAKMNSLFPKPQRDASLDTAPGKTELLEPTFMAKVSGAEATLKWKDVDGANAYHLQVSTEPNFVNGMWLKVDENPIKATSYTVKGLEAGKHYYWRVAAYKLGNKAAHQKGWFAKSMFETK